MSHAFRVPRRYCTTVSYMTVGHSGGAGGGAVPWSVVNLVAVTLILVNRSHLRANVPSRLAENICTRCERCALREPGPEHLGGSAGWWGRARTRGAFPSYRGTDFDRFVSHLVGRYRTTRVQYFPPSTWLALRGIASFRHSWSVERDQHSYGQRTPPWNVDTVSALCRHCSEAKKSCKSMSAFTGLIFYVTGLSLDTMMSDKNRLFHESIDERFD